MPSTRKGADLSYVCTRPRISPWLALRKLSSLSQAKTLAKDVARAECGESRTLGSLAGKSRKALPMPIQGILPLKQMGTVRLFVY